MIKRLLANGMQISNKSSLNSSQRLAWHREEGALSKPRAVDMCGRALGRHGLMFWNFSSIASKEAVYTLVGVRFIGSSLSVRSVERWVQPYHNVQYKIHNSVHQPLPKSSYSSEYCLEM